MAKLAAELATMYSTTTLSLAQVCNLGYNTPNANYEVSYRMDVRQQPQRPHESVAAPVSARMSEVKSTGLSKRLFFILASILAVLGILGLLSRGYSMFTADQTVKSSEYQALFLTNGQVYFGHLSHTSGEYVKLTDIYYLQVQQTVQPGSTATNQQQQVSLAKLGSELHGPEDQMYVAKNQVLFFENLKKDGKVTAAITAYIAGQKK